MVDNLQYIAGGGTFLGIASVAVFLIIKLQSNAEEVFGARADRQTATIKDLDEVAASLRKQLEACHSERAQMASDMAALQTRVGLLEKRTERDSDGQTKKDYI